MKLKKALWPLALLVPLASPLLGQDSSGNGVTWGNFQTEGSVTAAYRFADVRGFRPQYQQMFDLFNGLRLDDFRIDGNAKPGTSAFSDGFELQATGLGGDPFETVQLGVTKHNLYDFRADWRQDHYFFNQNDAFVWPGGQPGLTPNQNWDTVRKLGSAALTLHATNQLRLFFHMEHAADSGNIYATQSPDFLGAPDFWGFYARGNPFVLFEPLRDNSNEWLGGFDYTDQGWTFHLGAGYQMLDETVPFSNITSPQVSIDGLIKGNSTDVLLNLAQSEARRLTSPVGDFSYTGALTPDLTYRGQLNVFDFKGPANFVQNFNGVAPANTANTSSITYAISQQGTAQVSAPEVQLSQGLDYTVNSWLSTDIFYSFYHLKSEASGSYYSLFNGTPTSNTDQTDWRIGMQNLTFALNITPWSNLVVRPGIHLMKNNVESVSGGEADPALTLTTKTIMPELSLFYSPVKNVTLRGDVHSYDAGTSYFAISPHTQNGGHLQAKWQINDRFSLDDSVQIQNAKLLDTAFVDRVRVNSTALTFNLNSWANLFAGFTYDSEFDSGQIQYIRGTPPLADSLREQTVNRVIQGGFEIKPVSRFGVRFTGNYDHTSGIGQVSGEPPSDGPVTWPLATGTAYLDLPTVGRFSVDVQRTYYIQQIFAGDNFSANVLTLRWTRNF